MIILLDPSTVFQGESGHKGDKGEAVSLQMCVPF